MLISISESWEYWQTPTRSTLTVKRPQASCIRSELIVFGPPGCWTVGEFASDYKLKSSKRCLSQRAFHVWYSSVLTMLRKETNHQESWARNIFSIEIPADINALQNAKPKLAVEWREATRRA